jgi:hypothetical protein
LAGRRCDPLRCFGGLYDDPFDVGWGIEVTYHFVNTKEMVELASQILDLNLLPSPQ